MKIGIIGFGSIGSTLFEFIQTRLSSQASVTSICELDQQLTQTVIKHFPNIKLLDIRSLIQEVDLVIECANTQLVPEIIEGCLTYKKNVIIMSIGGLADNQLLSKIHTSLIKVYIPSGAIGGLDVLKAAKTGEIYKVKLITQKSPMALKDAPYFAQKNISAEAITSRTVIFSGNALEAIAVFPKNINVAMALSLAGIGWDKTQVEIIADPSLTKNCHEIILEGDFGRMQCITENEPFARNPKTSRLAALSCQALLVKLLTPLEIGT